MYILFFIYFFDRSCTSERISSDSENVSSRHIIVPKIINKRPFALISKYFSDSKYFSTLLIYSPNVGPRHTPRCGVRHVCTRGRRDGGEEEEFCERTRTEFKF